MGVSEYSTDVYGGHGSVYVVRSQTLATATIRRREDLRGVWEWNGAMFPTKAAAIEAVQKHMDGITTVQDTGVTTTQ